jgi:hypothetical protein
MREQQHQRLAPFLFLKLRGGRFFRTLEHLLHIRRCPRGVVGKDWGNRPGRCIPQRRHRRLGRLGLGLGIRCRHRLRLGLELVEVALLLALFAQDVVGVPLLARADLARQPPAGVRLGG